MYGINYVGKIAAYEGSRNVSRCG